MIFEQVTQRFDFDVVGLSYSHVEIKSTKQSIFIPIFFACVCKVVQQLFIEYLSKKNTFSIGKYAKIVN